MNDLLQLLEEYRGFQFLLCFLELNFLFLSLAVAHSLKKYIGHTTFIMIAGALLVFAQIFNAAGLTVNSEALHLSMAVAPSIIMTPFLAALLITYVLDGFLAAQRLTLATLAVSGCFYMLFSFAQTQFSWSGFTVESGMSPSDLAQLFDKARLDMAATLAAVCADLLVLPVIFQIFANRRYGTFFSVTFAFMLTGVIDTFVFTAISEYAQGSFLQQLSNLYSTRALAILWLSVMTTIYILMRKNTHSSEMLGPRNPMNYLKTLLTSYSSSAISGTNLLEWEGRFQMFIENSSDLVILVDEQGVIRDVNHSMLSLTKKEMNQIVDQNLSQFILADRHKCPEFLDEILEDTLPLNELLGHALQAEGEGSAAVILSELVLELDHSILAVEFSISPVHIGKRLLFVLTGRDTTLKHELSHRSRDLEEQVEHMQKMESIGRIAGGVAHDFNNLLHTIQAGLDSIAERKDPLRRQESISNVNLAIDRASELVQSLLSYARKGNVLTAPDDLNRIAEKAWKLFEPTGRKNSRLRKLLYPDPLPVLVDKGQLEQVFLNLLINASDALEDRRDGKISLRTEPAREKLAGWYDHDGQHTVEDFCCIRIKDNGSGIPDELIDKVFEPFFTTKPVGKGTGMGLSMAFGTISSHNGWMHVESSPEKGTEFYIYLPLHR